MQFHALIIGLAAIFQAGAVILAVRLNRITGVKSAWVLVSAAITISFVRRMVNLSSLLVGLVSPQSFHDEVIALITSALMFAGLALIAPLFRSIRRSEEVMKAAMVKTAEEKAKTDSIIAAIGDGISIQDIDLNIVYQNAIHVSYFGDRRGEKCYQAYRHRDSPCEPCPVLSSFDDGGIHSSEIIKNTEKGTSYFMVTTSPLRDANGEIIAGIEAVHNFDRRKKIELEREKLISELQEALANIKTLRGLLPICAGCKKVRDDKGYWNQIESYVKAHSEAEFSHSLCPDCAKELYPEYYDA